MGRKAGVAMKGCYLLHFETPFHHARHYVGWSSNIALRIQGHERGNSAKLIHAISVAGIRFQVVRLWIDTDRAYERRLHNRHNSPRLCPVCSGKCAPGYSVDVKRTLFEKGPPALGSRQGKRRPLEVL